MIRNDRSSWIPAVLVTAAALPAPSAYAVVYSTPEAARKNLFPQAMSMDEVPIALTDEQRASIATVAGPQAAHGKLQAWAARGADRQTLGYVFIDEVVGRQDFITYAVGIDADGKLRPVEILEYRESHGGEIRNKRWLAQFEGRSAPAQLRFGADIKNIAGATLSSEHVTAGVRRILAIWQAAFAPHAS
jgi:Na+-translocating ferredoxin:NAD+ oxidoreductase RnfG subunit